MVKAIERVLAPFFLALSLILGGASAAGHAANGVLQLIGLGVIALLILGGHVPALPPLARRLMWLLMIAAAVMVLQLVPLPAALWQLLPGHGDAAAGYRQLGIDPPWLPISLAPDSTVAALLALIPPIAMALATFASSGYGRIYAVYTLIAFAIGSVLFGVLQRYQGPDSAYYLYEYTNRGRLVGFFANRNHLATMLLVSLPFIAALAISPSRKTDSQKKIGRRMLTGCALLFVSLGIVVVKSAAGWMLLFPVLVACILIFQRGETGRYGVASMTTAAAVAVISTMLALFAPINLNDLGDKMSGVGQNKRNETIAATLTGAPGYLPFGSGGGSFLTVYPTFENPAGATTEYVSHAHSDYAEIFLEYGLLGLAMVGLALAWWVSTFSSVWSSASTVGALGRAGFVGVGVAIAHSVVDYPLRTAAIAALVGMAAALMVAPEPSEAPVSQFRRKKKKRANRSIYIAADMPAPAKVSEIQPSVIP